MSSTKTKSLLVRLPLAPEALAKFPHEPSSKSSDKLSSSPNTPAQIVEPTPLDTPADAATPMDGVDNGLLAPPATDAKGKKKAGPRVSAGTKRSAAAVDGTPKPRGKPGPKKKQRMGDMINDPNNKAPFAATAPAQKLGPKANMGTINANLRALDRSGKPCRKWGKKSFQIRSFTGVVWQAPTWRAPPKSSAFSEDVKSDTTGSSDSKIKDESSAVSDRSGLNGDAGTPVPQARLASSPTPLAGAS
ncbi:hypothetical protein DPSP01_009297 [Paraphaeosphaeria sporulosa]|uniref:DUF1711-domain-containing protein n=1 Tax=Paraphaeosphaeria sporulosa TaxID=1460663 RepID=A0A177C1S4_9PLEO|nr:uncharacterized protein CC84DRAFT_1168024 [Paraphaeosphaeria sporulosa]OAG00792.1 hypothetical protein CC84DRAFT_1168024 [Paraphaeosphaeria sporulosa]